MPGTIQNLEILSVGNWRASTGKASITEQTIDQLVESFSALQGSNIVKPHLKLGHEESQKWFGQKEGIPTLGWVTRVWRAGTKLLADIADVPDALIEMIKQKRYHNVSAEVYLDAGIEHAGRKFDSVLSAVALLGTEMPAAKDLAGLAYALYSERSDSVDASKLTIFQENDMTGNTPGPTYSKEQVDQLVDAAVSKATVDTKATFSAEIADLKAKLEVADKRATSAEANIVKMANDHAQAEAVSLVDGAIKEGRMLPKQRETALGFLRSAGKVKLSDGTEKTAAVLFKEFLDLAGKQVSLKEKGKADDPKGTEEFKSPGQEVDAKTKLLLKEDKSGKLTYATAMAQVLEADPELKNRYSLGEDE